MASQAEHIALDTTADLHGDRTDDTARQSPFFIVGSGRCGSTLLQGLLSNHEQVRIPPETHYFLYLDPAVYGIDSLETAEERSRYIDCVRANSEHSWTEIEDGVLEEYFAEVRAGMIGPREQFLWLVDRATRGQAGHVVGEKTPAHWMKLDRIMSLFPDAKIIHIYRDPRAVTEALLRMDWWHNKSVTWTAKYCRRTLACGSRWGKSMGDDRFVHVRFEDLLMNMVPEIERVCGFLGIEYSSTMLKTDDDENGYVRPTDPSRLTLYRERLSVTQIAQIEMIVGGDLMSSFGYEIESSGSARLKSLPGLAADRVVDRSRKYGRELAKIGRVFGASR